MLHSLPNRFKRIKARQLYLLPGFWLVRPRPLCRPIQSRIRLRHAVTQRLVPAPGRHRSSRSLTPPRADGPLSPPQLKYPGHFTRLHGPLPCYSLRVTENRRGGRKALLGLPLSPGSIFDPSVGTEGLFWADCPSRSSTKVQVRGSRFSLTSTRWSG